MTLASSDPRRSGFPVARAVVPVTVPISGTSAEVDVQINGRVQQIHFVVPNLEGASTAELLLHDADDNVLYASGDKAESTTYAIVAERWMMGTTTVRVECSEAQASAAVDFLVYLYYV